MSDNGFFIFLSVVVICGACILCRTKDPMAQQIHEINNMYPFDKEAKSKLVSELIRKHQPATNAPTSVQLKQ